MTILQYIQIHNQYSYNTITNSKDSNKSQLYQVNTKCSKNEIL